MKKTLTTFALLLVFIINAQDFQQTDNSFENIKIEKPSENEVLNISHEFYTMQIQVETTKNNEHNLIITIALNNDSSFISSYSKPDFKGEFYMDLGSYTHLNFENNNTKPRPAEEFEAHPYINGLVNWVDGITTYTQPLNILNKEDFEVFGRVKFTIEPNTNLEQVPFGISYKSGKMTINAPKC
jgi:hypothetical protein